MLCLVVLVLVEDDDFLPWQAVNRTETETAAVAMVANFLNLETDTWFPPLQHECLCDNRKKDVYFYLGLL